MSKIYSYLVNRQPFDSIKNRIKDMLLGKQFFVNLDIPREVGGMIEKKVDPKDLVG